MVLPQIGAAAFAPAGRARRALRRVGPVRVPGQDWRPYLAQVAHHVVVRPLGDRRPALPPPGRLHHVALQGPVPSHRIAAGAAMDDQRRLQLSKRLPPSGSIGWPRNSPGTAR